MPRKFNPGDTVRLIRNNGMNANVGALAVVKAYHFDAGKDYVQVEWIRNGDDMNEPHKESLFEERFELVAPAVKQLKPLDKVTTHPDEIWRLIVESSRST